MGEKAEKVTNGNLEIFHKINHAENVPNTGSFTSEALERLIYLTLFSDSSKMRQSETYEKHIKRKQKYLI